MKQNTCIVCGGDLTYDCGEWRCMECGELNDIVELYTEREPSTEKRKRKGDTRPSKNKKTQSDSASE